MLHVNIGSIVSFIKRINIHVYSVELNMIITLQIFTSFDKKFESPREIFPVHLNKRKMNSHIA